MIIENQYKYILTDRFGVIEVSPIGESDFTIEHEQDDDGKYFYSKQFNGKIIFLGDIYSRLKTIEQSIYLCTEQRLQIYRLCGDTEILIFDGYFKLSEGDWDDDICAVTIKFQKSTPDKCISDNKSVKINILQNISNPITVKTGTVNGVIEYKNCQTNTNTQIPEFYWCDTGDPEDGNWVAYQWSQSSPDGSHFFTKTYWAREVVTVVCGETVPADWILIEQCIGGNEKYAKKVTLYDCVVVEGTYNPDTGEFNNSTVCKIVGYTEGNTIIDNGRKLNDVIKYFINQFCPALQVVSDFFQINPENPSIINYVTGENTEVNNLILFQKADVKRPNAINNSSRAEWSFEKLMQTLNFMFNVYYRVDDGVFRLEHISWFTRNQGLDLTDAKYNAYTSGMRKYSYDIDSIPTRENWMFKEQISGGLYSGTIDYSISCVSSGKNTETNYLVDELMTDVQYALNNPSSDNKFVEDTGFVMVATRVVAGVYYILQDEAINDALAWAKLIPNYHYYNRPVNEGVYRGNDVTFFSTKPIKKGVKISVPIECNYVFDPSETINTVLGVGIVEKAEYNLKSCMIDLDLKYNVFGNLTNNEPPVIESNNTFQTYAGQSKIFNIVASDSDGVVESITLTYAPNNGTLEILSLSQVKYTPNPGFSGLDLFGLTAFDDWSQASAQTVFPVNVLPANQPPTAVNDTYTVYHEIPFTAPFSIFQNDSDDFGFTLVTTTVTTAQGIVVSINPTTGIFSYTPPSGFIGADTFQYTIEDNNGLQSTATVTLNVSYNSRPVAVDDTYQTKSNTSLSVDGVAERPLIIENDYAADGISYPLTATAETKSTALGGTVTIFSDGKFNYTPPSGVVSQIDNFDYTVNNANGNDIGNVKISILPTIYVKIVRSDLKTVGHPTQDNYYRTADYTIYFYSDSAGTIPMDVTGMGFQVNIKQTETQSISGGGTATNVYIWRTQVLSGTSKKIYDDFIYYSAGGDVTETTTIIVHPGSYNIIV